MTFLARLLLSILTAFGLSLLRVVDSFWRFEEAIGDLLLRWGESCVAGFRSAFGRRSVIADATSRAATSVTTTLVRDPS